MRVIVTGGAGFIGSHLCEAYMTAGHECICVDNLITGRLSNIVHLIGRPGFSFRQHNICDPLFVDGVIDLILDGPAKYRSLESYQFDSGRIGCQFLAPSAPNRQRCGI